MLSVLSNSFFLGGGGEGSHFIFVFCTGTFSKWRKYMAIKLEI
jgi:hypothetical protein